MEAQVINKQQELQVTTPDMLLQMAVDKNLDIDKLAKLMDLQRSWEADKARKAFFQALSEFQSKCPVLIKTKQVSFNQTKYKYTPLSDITEQIKGLLGEVGLTYRWENSTEDVKFKTTCIITHKDGHSESTSMSAAADNSGGKNSIQAIGSTITYLQRYTLIGALGISSADEDVDGKQENVQVLHKEYMLLYNQLIQKGEQYSKYHPDNWNADLTSKNYRAAIKDVTGLLKRLQ
jgi:hypothetical protein